MVTGWKIIAATIRPGGGPPTKEYFLVAIADRDEAVRALRERKRLGDVELTVAGEATSGYLEWLDVRAGEILSVLAVS
jgi:hypothetical protein